MNDSIGIDISKAHLDVYRLGSNASARLSNDAAGFRALKCWIGNAQPDLVVFEATGPYHGRFERAFAGRLPLVKVNPLQARRFAQARGTRAKTDTVDARLLAQMGSALDLVPDAPAAQNQHELKELQIARTALINESTRLMNRLKTQTLALTRRQTKARLARIRRELDALRREKAKLIDACPRRARAYAILRSIRGIGEVTAAAILIECPEIGTLGKKQAASLAGLAPMTRQSGTWKGKAFIQGGRKYLRDALYMPALVASRFNPDLRDKYQAMIKAGKPPKVAITAIMRKLIELANALIKADREWTPKLA
jgi:transposase